MISLIAVLAVVTLPCISATIVPNAKWGQDMSTVYLSIAVACEPETRSMAISNSSFAFSCSLVPSGQEAALTFEFKEDMNAADHRTMCKTLRKGGSGFVFLGFCSVFRKRMHTASFHNYAALVFLL